MRAAAARAAAASLAVTLVLAGCAGRRAAPARTAPAPLAASPVHAVPAPAGPVEPAPGGVVHVVRRGETVWRIARAYGITPAELMAANGISDSRAVAAGARLVVPGAAQVVEVPPIGAPLPPAAPPAALAPAPAAAVAAVTARAPADPSPSEEGTPASVRAGPAPLAWPLRGVLYGRFGARGAQRHDGIDIAAPEGTVVLAAADGTVIYVGEQAGYGALVILRHDDGLVTLYAHNSELLVREGARVRRGTPVAKVGQTGRTTGPHLHFEVRQGTRPMDPLLLLP